MINQNIANSYNDLSQRKAARVAGLLYLMNAVFAIVGVIARSSLVVPGDAVTTANNIMANELVYQFSFMSNVMMMLVGVFLPLALYVVLKQVDKNYSALFVILLLISVPIMCINLVSQFAALLLVRDAGYLTAFGSDQLYSLVNLFLELEEIGYAVAKIFFGIWLLPLGYLVYKSGYFPKILGILLVIACFSYLIDFSTFFLFPSIYESISMLVVLPIMIGEMAFTFWLLLKGAKIPG
jgi:hypothetical protein